NPFGTPVVRPTPVGSGAHNEQERRRVTTGMGLGHPAPNRSAPPPLPRRKPPAQKGGTLGGVGAGTPPELAHAVPANPASDHASFDDDEPTHVGAPPDAFAMLRPE